MYPTLAAKNVAQMGHPAPPIYLHTCLEEIITNSPQGWQDGYPAANLSNFSTRRRKILQ